MQYLSGSETAGMVVCLNRKSKNDFIACLEYDGGTRGSVLVQVKMMFTH